MRRPEGDPGGGRSPWAEIVGGILEEARRRAGKGPALALRLEQLGVVGERGERYSESSISNWIRGRAKPPAEVVLAAAQAADISLDDRLGIGRQASGLEQQLAEVRDELARQRRQTSAVEARLEELAAHVGSGGSAPKASTGSGGAEAGVLRDIDELVAQVARVGERLGRPAAEPSGISYADQAASPAERIARKVGALEARLAEVAGMVGAPYGGYPAAPGPSATIDQQCEWAVEVMGMIRHQLVEVAARAERIGRESGRARPTAERDRAADGGR